MNSEQAYEWLAPKLHTSEREALDVIRKDAKRYLTMLENLETLVLRTKTGATLTLKAARRGAEANRRGADATLDGLGAA